MKDEKGITLIALVLTIIIMVLLVGVVAYSGVDSINSAKKVKFISELETIQAKVNTIYEKRKSSDSEKIYYDNLGKAVTEANSTIVSKALGSTETSGFKYFTKTDLQLLDLSNIGQDVLINFDTRRVVSLTGLEIDGKMCYSLLDIPGYNYYNISYVGSEPQAVAFSLDKKKLASSYKFELSNISTNSESKEKVVSYKLQENENWILNGENTTFSVSEPGIYDIKLTDGAGNSSIKKDYVYVENGLLMHFDAQNNTIDGYNSAQSLWLNLQDKSTATLVGYGNSVVWENEELKFDGNAGYVDTGKTLKQVLGDNAKELTISATTYVEDISNFRGIVGNQNSIDNRGVFVYFEDGNLVCGYGDSEELVKANVNASSILNKLVNITVVFKENKDIKVYINGVLQDATITGESNKPELENSNSENLRR